MTRAGSVLVALAVAVLVAGCSSSDASPVSGSTSPESPVTSSDPPPVSTTIAPSTTAGPTTTIDPAVDLAAEVEADLLEAFRLGREAWQDPFDAAAEQAALDRRLGVVQSDLRASLADYRARNYALRANPGVPASVTVEAAPRFLGGSQDVAEVDICEINSWVVVEVGAGPGGGEAIVDPSVVASRATVFMRNVDGEWRFEGSTLIKSWEGLEACPDA